MTDTEILKYLIENGFVNRPHEYKGKMQLSDPGCGCCSYATDIPEEVAVKMEELAK